jgi:hypothetical protein
MPLIIVEGSRKSGKSYLVSRQAQLPVFKFDFNSNFSVWSFEKQSEDIHWFGLGKEIMLHELNLSGFLEDMVVDRGILTNSVWGVFQGRITKEQAEQDLINFHNRAVKTKPAIKTTRKPQEKSHEKVKKTPKLSDHEWDAIEQEYRAGQLSLGEIAARYNTKHQTISIRAKRKQWTRCLSDRVKKLVAEKLVADVANGNTKASDDDIAEAAAERGKEVVLLQRKDIANLRRLEKSLIDEIQNNPTKLYLTQYQGRVIEKIVGLTASERAMAANNLANVQHKRISLERQAFNLDDKGALDDLIEKLQVEFV